MASPMSGAPKKKLTFEVAPEIHRAFKLRCVELGLTVRQRLTFLMLEDLQSSSSISPDELASLRALADLPAPKD